jgi:agmatinase
MFPGARADRAEADYALVGAPLDVSTTFQPGTRFGPRRVRAQRQFEDYDHHTGQRFSDLAVHDHGDVRPGRVEEYLEFLRSTLAEYREANTVPLVVGGEHTVTVGAVRALEPDVYVCLDAHLDLRESYAGDPTSHATVNHHVAELADTVVVLGARAGTESEWDRVETTDGIRAVAPEAVDAYEPEFPAEARVYLSVDIDAADPGFAPGTGTPEPFGLEPRTMHAVVRELAPRCVGFDVVEVNDRDDGQAAALGAKLLRAFVYAHADATPG